MKKSLLYILAIMPFALFSCLNDDDPEPFVPPTHAEEVQSIEDFLDARNIAYQSDTSGMRYYIDSVGTGPAPREGDTVSVRYTGFFPGGNVFDSNENGLPLEFVIGEGRVIRGFEYSVLKLNEGGAGTFFLPSRLAYGSTGGGPIPPYTIIGFEVHLISVR
ncbi:FKBP-type peptidyl-prolyl cis-trans isomerase [Roseivirga sp. BDSF3-8]|uniref:FKBP-type peptidyl-prolyl cis-trans isomerase n=1 Tax=Roseivirga sp. BDSF3-8 TaxID=3241598 RepID=UPI003531EF1A